MSSEIPPYKTREEALEFGEPFVYRGEGETALRLYVFGRDPGAEPRKPGILLIHGGGWRQGSPAMLAPQALYFASRGMVAISIQYRLLGQPGVKGPQDCLADARVAMRWVKRNSAMLGIDPARIVASGGSAGGHLAAALGSVAAGDQTDDADQPDCTPHALVLFNPAYDLVDGWADGRRSAINAGLDPAAFSPAHLVKPGFPPTLVLSGELDPLAPPATNRAFVQRMEAAGNRVKHVEYAGAKHGFFNFGEGETGNPWFTQTLAEADAFLVDLGILEKAAIVQ